MFSAQMSSAEAKAAVVPESVLRKSKREEQWAAEKKEKALADRKKALESRKIISARAKQYAQEYDAQVCYHLAGCNLVFRISV